MSTSASPLAFKKNTTRKLVQTTLMSLPLVLLVQTSVKAAPSEAEIIFSNEVIECASYYQISSDAIAKMDAPQMKAVGDRLKNTSIEALTLAQKYQSDEAVADVLSEVQQKQLAALPDNKSLGKLMGQYKDSCKSLLAEPQKRLDYWIMATM